MKIRIATAVGLMGLALLGILLFPSAATAQLPIAMAPSTDFSVELAPSFDDDLHVTVTNHGPNDASATVEVVIPAGLRVAATPAGCTLHETVITCTTRTQQPGWYTTFPVEVVQTARGPQQVQAWLSDSSLEDADGQNNEATTSIHTLVSPTPGADAATTAVEVSRVRFVDGAPFAVIARDDNYADSLAGSPLTADAPLLFTNTHTLTDVTAAELSRVVEPGGQVYILGGSGAVSAEVEQQIADLGLSVLRVAGASRYSTALAIADVARDLHGVTGSVIIARASGPGTSGWADAVAGGGLAARTGTPIVLVDQGGVPAEVGSWLQTREISATTIVGGSGAVADIVAAALPAPSRLAGPDRAATAGAVAEAYPDTASGYHVVNGYAEDGWVSGLLAAGLAADTGAPVLFTADQQVPDATAAMLTTCGDRVVPLAVVGGSIDEAMRSAMDELDSARCTDGG